MSQVGHQPGGLNQRPGGTSRPIFDANDISTEVHQVERKERSGAVADVACYFG